MEIKPTRRKYNYKDKIDMLTELNNSGLSISKYASIKNVPTNTIQDWKKHETEIFSIEKANLIKIKMGAGRKPILCPEIEIEILDWILSIRTAGLPITDELIICRAIFINKSMNFNIVCNFSNGWLENFKNRHKIVNRKVGSKIVRITDCSFKIIIDFIESVNYKINSKNYYSVINIDETGIFIDSPINFTLEIKGTKRVDIITTGREKQRVTVVLGVDLFRNIKMKPLVILKGKTKRCLKNIPDNDMCETSFQTNSWCTDDQFIKFLSFLPKNKKILLLYDNFRGHKTPKVVEFLKINLPFVDVFHLPPNTTSILQPLDVGVNKSFKSTIKRQYINWLIQNFEYRKVLLSETKINRIKLLIEWINNSWNNIDDDLIERSFNFCGYGNSDDISPGWTKFYNMET